MLLLYAKERGCERDRLRSLRPVFSLAFNPAADTVPQLVTADGYYNTVSLWRLVNADINGDGDVTIDDVYFVRGLLGDDITDDDDLHPVNDVSNFIANNPEADLNGDNMVDSAEMEILNRADVNKEISGIGRIPCLSGMSSSMSPVLPL